MLLSRGGSQEIRYPSNPSDTFLIDTFRGGGGGGPSGSDPLSMGYSGQREYSSRTAAVVVVVVDGGSGGGDDGGSDGGSSSVSSGSEC